MGLRGSTVLLIAALVLLVLLVVYAVGADPAWAQPGYWLANFIESPWAVYARSDGSFDAPARLALSRARDRPAPTAFDHALSGTIIARNLLGREHRPVVGADGAPTREARELAALRRGMLGEARNHFMEAVQRLGAAARPRALADEPNAGFVLDAAAEFAFGGVLGALANDPLMAVLVAEDGYGGADAGAEDWPWLPIGLGLGPGGLGLGAGFDPALFVDAPLAAAATRRREELVTDRQAAARQTAEAEGGALGAAADTYVALAVQNTNDGQNSHDTSVLACLRAVVGRLRADQGAAALPSLDQIREEIRAEGDRLSSGRPGHVTLVEAVLVKVGGGERVVALGATDEECLRRVWLRSDDPRNAENRGRLRQAIFDALHDCWEPGLGQGHIVCVNGRTSRILSSLVLLDWDRRNWTVKRLEQFKNDIFERARAVIQARAEAAVTATDPDYCRAGRLYLATSLSEADAIGEVPERATAALAADMRAAITAMVDEYLAELAAEGVSDAIPPHMVEAVKMEAAAAVV